MYEIRENYSKNIAISAMVMAAYVVLTVAFAPISYGPVQVRLAAGLYTLAAPMPFVTMPLMIATALANWFGGLGVLDVIFGPLATGAACFGCWLFRYKRWLIPAAIPLFSAPVIAGFLSIILQLPFWVLLIQIAIGQAIAAYTIGLAVIAAHDIYDRRNEGI